MCEWKGIKFVFRMKNTNEGRAIIRHAVGNIPKDLAFCPVDEAPKQECSVVLRRCRSLKIPSEFLVKAGSASSSSVLGMCVFDGTDKRRELDRVGVDDMASILKLSLHPVRKPNRYAMYLLSATRTKAYLAFVENKSEGFRTCETASSELPPNILMSSCVLIFRDRRVYPDGHVVFIHPSHEKGQVGTLPTAVQPREAWRALPSPGWC